jgi:hypothetical protein
LRTAEGGEAISQPARRLLRRARNALLAATRDFVKTVIARKALVIEKRIIIYNNTISVLFLFYPTTNLSEG